MAALPGSQAPLALLNVAVPSPLPANAKIFRVRNAENGDQSRSGLNAGKERAFVLALLGAIAKIQNPSLNSIVMVLLPAMLLRACRHIRFQEFCCTVAASGPGG